MEASFCYRLHSYGKYENRISGVYMGALIGSASGTIDNKTVLSVKNCVTKVNISCTTSNYAGGILGRAATYVD